MRNSPHGRGILWFKNGDRYDGEWVEGNPRGICTYTLVDGTFYGIEWDEEGHLVALVVD